MRPEADRLSRPEAKTAPKAKPRAARVSITAKKRQREDTEDDDDDDDNEAERSSCTMG